MEILQVVIIVLLALAGSLTLLTALTSHKRQAMKLGAYFLIVLGLISIVSYTVGTSVIYTMSPHATPVTLPTAIGFVIIGSCLLIVVGSLWK